MTSIITCLSPDDVRAHIDRPIALRRAHAPLHPPSPTLD